MSRRTWCRCLPALGAALGLCVLVEPGVCRAQNQPSGPYPVPPGPALPLPAQMGGGFPLAVPATPAPGPNRPAPNLPGRTPAAGAPQPWAPGPGFSGMATASPYSRPPAGASLTNRTLRTQPPPVLDDSPRVRRFLKLVNGTSGLDWPLALRILPPGPVTTQLREDIDRLAAEVQKEAESGQVSPALFEEIGRDLHHLHQLMAARADLLPVSQDAVEEGRRFLRTVRDALR